MKAGSDVERQWAKRGAAARLVEIDAERAAILKAFPELKAGGAGVAAAPGRRRQISAAARRAMSAGMRRYWARRKSQGKHATKP